MKLTESELATILAALRHLVEFYNEDPDFQASLEADWPDHFAETQALSPDAIDGLCDRLNAAETIEDAARPLLAREDWIEIYYALESKLELVRGWSANEAGAGVGEERSVSIFEEGPHPHAGDDAAWIAQLERIIEAIGPDGQNMPHERREG